MAANGLITDLYQLTMANALFKKGMHERRVVFDRFYRKNPFNGGLGIRDWEPRVTSGWGLKANGD